MRESLKRLGLNRVIDWVFHPKAFGYAFLFACMFLYGLVYVDIPTRDKTVLNIGLDTYLENWRLHSNTKELFAAKDSKDTLQDECAELERIIEKLRLSRWQLMAIAKDDAGLKIEIEKIASTIGAKTKKLLAAESSLMAATHLYDRLVASR